MKPNWPGNYGCGDLQERREDLGGRAYFYRKFTPEEHAETSAWLRQWACAATSGQSNITALPTSRTRDRDDLGAIPRFDAILAYARANPVTSTHHYYGLTGKPKARI